MCFSIVTPKTINFPFVPNGKFMVFRCHNILVYIRIVSWGAFDLPESESGFEIMILIHRFILANRKHDFESGGSYSVYDFK